MIIIIILNSFGDSLKLQLRKLHRKIIIKKPTSFLGGGMLNF